MLAVGAHRGGASRPWTHDTRDALRWLGAPPTLLALAVLVLNDHVLKQSAPGFVTGKLSDVAGLVLAPALLAVVLTLLRIPRAAPVALVATAVGFTLVKTTTEGVEVANHLWSAVGWPTQMLRDPTDLIALPGLLLAAHVSRAERRRGAGARRRAALALGALALPFAVVATAATSPCTTWRGLESVGVVNGDFSGPPSRTEHRVVIALSYQKTSIDVDGRWTTLNSLDEARVGDLGPTLEEACSVEAPRRCWRRTPDTREPWVEASDDGGATWSTDYRMPSQQLDRLRQDAEGGCKDDPPPFFPQDIAVLDTPHGPMVAVASGRAGLLLRDPDGTWSQVSTDDLGQRPGTAPTPDPDVLFTPVDPTPSTTARGPMPSSTPPIPPRPTTPCATRTVVTVTPNPRNGTPFPREVCVG
ncbi:hypothetical protein SAMN05216199_4118 [Pedococcus cremeus]|uniref:Uncharacterized protein n=1 Tax=Pedococcus cremeus TaxID=587636 RepID=A0A1H9XNF3_9MICO|nr:hypothetical protein SAMN05216199_4118 [Pedococcus cremeus]